ncbi:hypothetical protein J4G02_21100 [Candidatus Poribacteria bacterium]|nr:hypothetical protein [Candidatus Poribacteria bacterium]
MTTTIDKLLIKTERIERELAEVRQALEELRLEPTIQFVDKEKLRPLTAKAFEEMGVLVAACGVKAEDNIFSQGIIEMREE